MEAALIYLLLGIDFESRSSGNQTIFDMKI
jgi:hypothetical protein